MVGILKLKNKYVLVTGASTGIGRAIAIEFAKEGACVALTARTEDRLSETKRLIEKAGGKAKVFVADLSELASTNALIEKVRGDTKHVDVIVNVAGVWHDQGKVFASNSFESFSQPEILKTLSVGITAPTLIVHGLLPLMTAGSKILNISGKFSHGAKNQLPYYLSKKAIEDLTVGLSEELTDRKIQVNCISPSDTDTESYNKYYPRCDEVKMKPEEIAQHAMFLCSNDADNITGKVFVMIAGKKPYEAFHA